MMSTLKRNVWALVFLGATVAWSATKIVGVIMTNSTVDSTAIGANVPSTGAFTNLAGQYASLLRLTVSPGAGGGVWAPLSGVTAGANISYGQSGSLGETDFINQRGGNAGGFLWYNTNNGTVGTELMKLDSSGNLYTVGGNFVGNLSGNATTATNMPYSGLTGTIPTWNQNTTGTAAALTSAGTNCGSTGTAYGVDQYGNALCHPSTYQIQSIKITSVCTTSGAESKCTTSGGSQENWPIAFPDANYQAGCSYVGDPTGSGSSPGLYGPYITFKTSIGIGVEIQSGSASAAGSNTVPEIDCWAIHQ